MNNGSSIPISRTVAMVLWWGLLWTSAYCQTEPQTPRRIEQTLASADGQVQAWWVLEGDFVYVDTLTIRFTNSNGTFLRSFQNPVTDTCTSIGDLVCAEYILDLPRPMEITRVNDTVTVLRGFIFPHPLNVIILWIFDGNELYRVGCVTFRGVYDLDWKYDPGSKRLQLYGDYMSPGSDVFIPVGDHRVSQLKILQKRKNGVLPQDAYDRSKPLYEIQY